MNDNKDEIPTYTIKEYLELNPPNKLKTPKFKQIKNITNTDLDINDNWKIK